MNNISSAGENTPPLPENEYPLSHSSASAAALEGTPVSEVQPEGRTHFRPTQDGWEQRKRDATGAFIGDWQKTRELELFKDEWTYVGESEPEELQRSALASFGQGYNRADDIARKKFLYERELKSLQPSSDRAQFLTKLIPLFDRAIAYQNEIMERLQSRKEEDKGLRSENQAERAAAERQAILRDSIRLENILKINNRPNQVERLIEQIEKEEAERLDAQKQLAQVEARLTIPDQSAETLSSLNEAAENFRRAIAAYPEFIEARLDSARLIQAPYKKTEEIDPAIQNQIKASKEDLLKKQVLAQSSYQLGKNYHARTIVTGGTSQYLFFRSNYLTHQREILLIARREVERDEPRQAVIDLCFRAARLEEKAAALDNPKDRNSGDRAKYLRHAGYYLLRAAQETRKDKPRQAAIDYFLRASNFNERALGAIDNQNDPERRNRAENLYEAGNAFYRAAQEAEENDSKQAVINYSLGAADFYERAAAVLDKKNDPNRVLRAEYLSDAGSCCVTAAAYAGDNPKKADSWLKKALEQQSKARRLSLQPIEPTIRDYYAIDSIFSEIYSIFSE